MAGTTWYCARTERYDTNAYGIGPNGLVKLAPRWDRRLIRRSSHADRASAIRAEKQMGATLVDCWIEHDGERVDDNTCDVTS